MNQPTISIQDFTYNLPADRVALYPLLERDQSKLLVYQNGNIQHSNFSKLSQFLPNNSILFFNNTKVIPARLIFKKETGAEIEIFLLDPHRHPPQGPAQDAGRKSHRQPHQAQGREEQSRSAIHRGGVRHHVRRGHQPREPGARYCG